MRSDTDDMAGVSLCNYKSADGSTQGHASFICFFLIISDNMKFTPFYIKTLKRIIASHKLDPDNIME